ncbi:MAG: DUF86 domain-containing protein [Polyangiaceae bacterium]|nr:DUF86 domain-containing protein [Polyangiaceae bacterium]
MTEAEIGGKLAVLRDNMDKLAQIPQASYDEFVADFRNVDSALRRLQTSIQALIDLAGLTGARLGLGTSSTSRELLERLEAAGVLPAGSTNRFGPIFGFRNRIVHLYDRVDERIVFRILTEERADLDALARLLVTALQR